MEPILFAAEASSSVDGDVLAFLIITAVVLMIAA